MSANDSWDRNSRSFSRHNFFFENSILNFFDQMLFRVDRDTPNYFDNFKVVEIKWFSSRSRSELQLLRQKSGLTPFDRLVREWTKSRKKVLIEIATNTLKPTFNTFHKKIIYGRFTSLCPLWQSFGEKKTLQVVVIKPIAIWLMPSGQAITLPRSELYLSSKARSSPLVAMNEHLVW